MDGCPQRRWRVVSVAQFVGLAGLVLSTLRPGPIRDYEEYDNPLGIGALSGVYDVASNSSPSSRGRCSSFIIVGTSHLR